MGKIDLTSKVERMEALEERVGVKLQSIYAQLSTDEEEWYLEVNYEVLAEGSPKLKHNHIGFKTNVYDDLSRIVATTQSWIHKENFYALCTLSETMELALGQVISKIRIYPEL